MPLTHQELQDGFRLGDYLIEPRQNRIVGCGTDVRIEPRVMDVLVCLAEHAGEVVSRDALNTRVWGNVVVTDQALTNCISELRHHLGDDRSANRVIDTIPKRGYRLTVPVERSRTAPPPAAPMQTATKSVSISRLVPAGLLVLGATLLASVLWWKSEAKSAASSVAVLRFENAAGDEELDYLALALPDEIATLLTKSRGLAVRPLGYIDGNDPIGRARARHVDHVVSGRYYFEDDRQLSLAIEAQQVDQDRVIWRTRITVPSGDALAIRAHIAESIRHGLLPALGATPGPISGSAPASGEAYQLYLRSLAVPKQPKPTEKAIAMLEQVVALEPEFAAAWHALGLRYYDHGTYGTGGEPARTQSLAAQRKALEIDPDMISAARAIITHLSETGELPAAYSQARRLLSHFGSKSEAHFALSYVYRFGGLLEESQQQCELALERDPQDPRLRSCGYAYLYAGELSRVMPFITLDEGSYFVHWGTVLYLLRRDDSAGALQIARQASDDTTRRLMEPCLEGVRGPRLDVSVAEFVRQWENNGDPEAAYAVAPMLSYCGRPEDALRFLERAVDRNFCAFPAVDLDPAWIALRAHPEFQRIRAKAIACRDRFREAIAAHDRRESAG